jgi:sporulation protein YlmC with PRC-barrel domain
MDSEDHRASHPFTEMEGYEVLDASGAGVGRVEDTVYAPSATFSRTSST